MSYVSLNAKDGEVAATYTSDSEHIEKLEQRIAELEAELEKATNDKAWLSTDLKSLIDTAYDAGMERASVKYKSLLFSIGADIAKTECTCVDDSLYLDRYCCLRQGTKTCGRCKIVEKFSAIRKEIDND